MSQTSSAKRKLILKSRDFRVEREEGWRELESILTQTHAGGIRALSAEQVHRLPLLYRSALSSLSVARSIALDRALVEYLANLSLRSFLVVYAPPIDLAKAMRDFSVRIFPQAVRSIRWQLLIVILVLVLGGVSGFSLVNSDEGWFTVIVPTDLANGRGPASTKQDLVDVLSARLPDDVTVLDEMANDLFAHNTLIALLTFSLGLLAGIPSILLVFMQGLSVGAFFALHYHRGLTEQFIGWISIHGVTEITALVLFGAAGLKLGELVVFPGYFSRSENLAIHGPRLGAVAVGGVAMLIVAAVLEGIFRQTVDGTEERIGFAILSLVFWLAYFTTSGRVDAT